MTKVWKDQRAEIVDCPVCGMKCILGWRITNEPVLAELVVVDIPMFVEMRKTKRRFWALMQDRVLCGPLNADTEFPMNAWRPEHPHAWTPPLRTRSSWHDEGCPERAVEPSSGAISLCSCPIPSEAASRPSTAPLRPSHQAVQLLKDVLGAVIIEYERNGRRVRFDN